MMLLLVVGNSICLIITTNTFAVHASTDTTCLTVLLALVANVPRSTVTAACTTYTIARLVYGAVYVLIPDDLYSQLRGIAWWTGNSSCLFLLWRAAHSPRPDA